jgi:hypothetical protein
MVEKEQPPLNSPEKRKNEGGRHTRATEFSAMRKETEAPEKRGGVKLTVIFTVPSDAQAPGLDSRKTKSNGFAQSGGIDVGYSILVANPSVREIEPLPWNIAIGVRGVIRSEPVKSKTKKAVPARGVHKKSRTIVEEDPRKDVPSLHKNLFGSVGCAGRSSSPDVRGQFFQSVVGCCPHAHPPGTPRSGNR